MGGLIFLFGEKMMDLSHENVANYWGVGRFIGRYYCALYGGSMVILIEDWSK